MQERKTAIIGLEGNPTTGYMWLYAMSPLGIVREVSNDYVPDASSGNMVGVGGKFFFTFEAITTGEVELVFSYLRPWEENTSAVQTITYKAIVDDKYNLTLTQM